jgi:hypothetical protein
VVTGCNPVRSLVKVPVPVPFDDLSLLIVGAGVVAQQIPRSVMVPPPSLVMFPPDDAVVEVIDATAVVVKDGITALVVKVKSFPYAVPSPLVA